jgi:hypothetical protein
MVQIPTIYHTVQSVLVAIHVLLASSGKRPQCLHSNYFRQVYLRIFINRKDPNQNCEKEIEIGAMLCLPSVPFLCQLTITLAVPCVVVRHNVDI